MADLQPQLPPGFAADIKLDTASPAYQHTLAAAKEAGMTQSQFSDLLGMEARKTMERNGVSGAPVNRMSFSQKMHASEVMSKARGR
jgi:hypothetical protein